MSKSVKYHAELSVHCSEQLSSCRGEYAIINCQFSGFFVTNYIAL